MCYKPSEIFLMAKNAGCKTSADLANLLRGLKRIGQ